MNLIPMPRKIQYIKEEFKLKKEVNIILDYNCSFDDLNSAILLQEEINNTFGFKVNITKALNYHIYNTFICLKKKSSMEDEEYKLSIKKDNIEINASTSKGLFYGIQTLIQIIREYGYSLPGVIIEDKPYFKHRGFYHDVTRGKVPKLETLMNLVDKASFYKINELQLYIEHTFAFKGMSEVWIDKDPLTSEEIILLDRYCKNKHIELIPSISTFGHLYEVLRTKSFKNLCELTETTKPEYSFVDRMAHHTLNVTDEDSIKLVGNMLEQFMPLFSSNKFNICCDETFDLGKGKSSKEADRLGIGKLYVDFLNKVISIVKEYDKEIMFWGDVILNHPDLINTIDKDAICLNWNYWCGVEEKDTKIIAESGRKQYVCPGVGGWSHLMNLMDNAFENIYRMISYGVKYDAIGVLNTNWGDYGHINLLSSSIPGMIYGAALSWNPSIEKDFNKMYKDISILEFGDSSGTLVSLLAELSKCQEFGWSELVIWKEKFNTNEHIKNELIRKMKTAKIHELKEQQEKILKIEEKLENLSHDTKDTKSKEIIQEFIVAARGILIINKIMIVIINNEIYKGKLDDNVNSTNISINNKIIKGYSDINNDVIKESISMNNNFKQLAESFEEWFYEYSTIWRKTNKESELYRIRDVIKYICSYLRDI
ncbi:MAG: glycoside hydrolase family 20 zincin-like fold domain-containing protein [Clostridium sp.]|uniref:beta-N-acetylhexosaminidase n=1 Tax=Clostridium TaxID=1485 RepID=UPI0022E89971|nr:MULTISPECIES: glycoside hydrolase family 20 zincin-like fold domain-containing protein [Clostridium]MDU1278059.1 glycoside hydrolase family 20 zincin-like fold domain-containing protein [Clostridium sp.]MDU7087139.1 glycoside hydrolase family 20 zincin-like fold domain-containing protein [Clostridium sp.]MDU7947330.1 glycoside hydrolase family 20 zincin-like fold domain-containing protein [Clostridium sp.]